MRTSEGLHSLCSSKALIGSKIMKVVAVGKREVLMGFMLAGVKETLETEDPEAALQFLHELEDKETDFLVIITSNLYRRIEEEIAQIQMRKPSFVFYNFSGGGLNWREK